MVGTTINLDNEKNRILELYKTKRGFKNKQEAIEDLIDKVSGQFTKEEINSDWRNDPATEKQLFKLKELKVKIDKNITKFEADVLIKENLK